MDKYKCLGEIGSGSYGVVFKALNNDSGETVAIKKLKYKCGSWNECLNLREVKFLRKLNHPNIIQLRELIHDQHHLFMVFEYMDSDLSQLILARRQGFPLLEQGIKHLCFQLFLGLSYMHDSGCFHRDLKPDNLLLNHNNDVIKIADLGLARDINSAPPYTQYTTTRWYRAPEVLLTSGIYGPQIDMWAMGAIMAELYNLRPLFPGKSSIDQLSRICKIVGRPSSDSWPPINFQFLPFDAAPLSEIIPSASEDALSLIGALLSWDPSKRPTALEALKHPFFSSYHHDTQLSMTIQPIAYENKIVDSRDSRGFVDEEAKKLREGSQIFVPQARRVNEYGVIGRRDKEPSLEFRLGYGKKEDAINIGEDAKTLLKGLEIYIPQPAVRKNDVGAIGRSCINVGGC
ncbi:hypothetical protein ACFE04_015697 [Oxalis oulophora]